jgi:hypothetical protein
MISKKLKPVIKKAHEKGLKVKFAHKKLGVWAGMNDKVAPLVGYRGCPSKTIMIDSGMPVIKQVRIGKHEIVERGRITQLTPKQRRMSKHKQYLLVHRYAEKHQRDNINRI